MGQKWAARREADDAAVDNPLQLAEPDGGWPDEDRTRNVSPAELTAAAANNNRSKTNDLCGMKSFFSQWRKFTNESDDVMVQMQVQEGQINCCSVALKYGAWNKCN